MSQQPVVIIGAGVAGLVCAAELRRAGWQVRVLEASDGVGGRVRSDLVDGYTLDRGFQVLLPAYPEARRYLPKLCGRPDALPLSRGAIVRWRGRFHRLMDPLRHPRDLLGTAASPLATTADKWRTLVLWRHCTLGPVERLMHGASALTTMQLLRRRGFSERYIGSFFRPFLGGVFLDPALGASGRVFEFVFRMFASGGAVWPVGGIGRISRALAEPVADAIELRSRVTAIEHRGGWRVRLADGETGAAAVVLACDHDSAYRLAPQHVRPPGDWTGATCFYFTAEQRFGGGEPTLVLGGDDDGPVNNLVVLSDVWPGAAPGGRMLISITTLHDASASDVLSQMRKWYGPSVTAWEHLRTYRIPRGLPDQSPATIARTPAHPRLAPGLYACGDWCDLPGINAAMRSGRHAAVACAQALPRNDRSRSEINPTE